MRNYKPCPVGRTLISTYRLLDPNKTNKPPNLFTRSQISVLINVSETQGNKVMANFFSKLGAQLDELLNGPELFEGEREARENLKEVKKAASSAADRVRQAKERLEREKAAIKEAKKIKKQSDDLYKQMSKDFDQVEKISERIIKLKAVKGQVIGEAKKHVENRVSDANDLLEGIDAMLELIDED